MKRAGDHMLLSMFVVLAACANDFDALFAGPPQEKDEPQKDPTPSSSGAASGGGSSSGAAPAPVVVPTNCKDPAECTVECSKGQTCEGSCSSAFCSFEVSGSKGNFSCTSSDCEMACTANAGCVLDCTSSASCDVTCDEKSSCVVKNCGDACSLTCFGGKPIICGDKTQACGACP